MPRLAFVISILVNLAALAFIWMLYPREIDYRGAMSDVLTFFQVHFCSMSFAASPLLLPHPRSQHAAAKLAPTARQAESVAAIHC